MSTRITDTAMSSTSTDHTARRTQPTGQWRVSWLPHRLLTRNEAATAMTIAEVIASRPAPHNHIWHAVKAWAAELDLSADEAKTLAGGRRLHILSTGCWCAPATATDGHGEPDGSDPVFAATDNDPISADGELLEVLR